MLDALFWLSRKPLFRFLLLGALLYVGYAWFGPRKRIAIPKELLLAKKTEFERRSAKRLGDDEAKSLVRDYIESEVLYREALRRRLGDGDIIVRRRLVEKMEQVAGALVPFSHPSEQQLRRHFEENKERFSLPSRVAFRQVFIDAAKHKTQADSLATLLLEKLKQGADSTVLGDPHLLGQTIPFATKQEIARAFCVELAEALFQLPDHTWSSPLRSPHGLHLLQITDRKPTKQLSFEQARETLRQELTEERRALHRKQAIERLVNQYEILWP